MSPSGCLAAPSPDRPRKEPIREAWAAAQSSLPIHGGPMVTVRSCRRLAWDDGGKRASRSLDAARRREPQTMSDGAAADRAAQRGLGLS
jgi:hypothetical protein